MPEPRPAASFPRTFWIANVMELFERAAYYGMNSVLAVYLTRAVADGGLGFAEQSVGFLQSIVYAMTYVLPILGGALADRYGYRRMLMVAFSLLAAGYFAAGFSSTYALVFLALLVMATGSGLFKPIISGTIARTTDDSNSAFGFGIYYWMINLGAFLAPLVVSWLKGFSWQYVFIASALYCALMLLPTLFVYTDPPRPESTKTLKQVLLGAAEVLGDSRFMLMIVVYSGFWILYFQNFGSVLWYLRDFIDGAPVSAADHGLLRRRRHQRRVQVRRRARHRHQRRHDHPAAGARQPHRQGQAGAADDGHRHADRRARVPAARLVAQRVGVRPRHRGVLHRRDDRAPEVLQLRRPRGAGRSQGRLHGLRVPLRRLRLAARLEPGRVPLHAHAEAGGRHAGGVRGHADVLADVRGAGRGRGGRPDPVRAGVHGRHAGDRRKARIVMRGVYVLVFVVGIAFCALAFSSTPVQYRTLVQSIIFLALGAGGLIVGLKKR